MGCLKKIAPNMQLCLPQSWIFPCHLALTSSGEGLPAAPAQCADTSDKRDFADLTKLRILIWEDYPGLSRWAWCNHKFLRRETQGNQTEGMVMTEVEGHRERFEEEEGQPWAKGCRWPLDAGKDKEADSTLEPPEETSLANTLPLVQQDWFQTSGLQNSKR